MNKISYIKKLYLFGLITLGSNFVIMAKEFGVMGHSYSVKEQSFLLMIKNRLAEIDIELEQQKMQETAIKYIKSPKRVNHINKATENKIFYWDPSYMIIEDILLPSGEVLHKKGKIINPLDYMDFDRIMLFIDGEDKSQIAWLKDRLAENHKLQNRIILIAGRPLELQEELQALNGAGTVYFDQLGVLTSKMGILSAPSEARVEKKLIRIEQFDI
jgi:conjugal transfer pilus assembly protein TraW